MLSAIRASRGWACVLVPLLGTVANAQDQIDPAEITATAGSMHSDPFPASNLLDGLTEEGFTNIGDPGPPERPSGHQNNHWIAAQNVFTETVTFELGGSYDLVRLEILNTSNTNWNDSETDTFTIAASTDGGATYTDPSEPIALQDYTLGFQEVPFSTTGTTHVQIVATNDPDAGTDTGTADVRVGFNEIRFFHFAGADTDMDGMVDDWEREHFGDLSRDGSEDEDIPTPDGLTNKQEHDRATDPKDPDSDDDELDDGAEVNIYGSNPLDSDSDDDTLLDGAEVNTHNSDPTLVDTDGEGLNDGEEVNQHMTRPDLADTDGDTLDDYLEINELGTDPLVPNADPRGTQIDPSTITAVAGSVFDDTGRFDASNMLDGLTEEGNRDTHLGTHWIAAEGTFTETVTFDLGGSYSLTTLEILNTSNTNWNDSETDSFTLATSSDGGATFSAPSEAVLLQDFDLGFQSVPLQAAGSTHVQFVVTNDQVVDGDPPPGVEARVGLNEVRFFSGPGTPFVITSIKLSEEEIGGGTQPIAEIVFNSDPGATYAVDFGFDMKVWFEADDSVSSDGKITTYIDRDQAVLARPRVYYRVRTVP